ncbi:hypothetical protein RFI_15781 [Reticulomyxa filosa]|uniref:PPM-type phosphatase domain-containing protein n=1 Tax=Reticulomyxa filosa TaxID=46433 RepID=X6N586_RETFI|nr:hypothetical protein RFI_15781 [Reticulomyxa filosa]|eukprot:ETO21425.1 hypothetical protein RFI_15781 [Reticulomyxa filosa]
MLVLGVFDGHGILGHSSSRLASKLIPQQFMLNWSSLHHEQPEFSSRRESMASTVSVTDSLTTRDKDKDSDRESNKEKESEESNEKKKDEEEFKDKDKDKDNDNEKETTKNNNGKHVTFVDAFDAAIHQVHNELVFLSENETLVFNRVLSKTIVPLITAPLQLFVRPMAKTFVFLTVCFANIFLFLFYFKKKKSKKKKMFAKPVGDSRGILMTYDVNEKRWVILKATADHNATTRADERTRVESAGGRLDPGTNGEMKLYPRNMSLDKAKNQGLVCLLSSSVLCIEHLCLCVFIFFFFLM